MRELLFRAKSAKGASEGRWVEGYHTCYQCGFREEGVPEHIIRDTRELPGDFYIVDPATLGQYTGLTDKKGRRIFEGDIVKVVEDYEEIYAIVWDEDTARYVLVQNGNAITDFGNVCGNAAEVIGNMTDNPELLDARAD